MQQEYTKDVQLPPFVCEAERPNYNLIYMYQRMMITSLYVSNAGVEVTGVDVYQELVKLLSFQEMSTILDLQPISILSTLNDELKSLKVESFKDGDVTITATGIILINRVCKTSYVNADGLRVTGPTLTCEMKVDGTNGCAYMQIDGGWFNPSSASDARTGTWMRMAPGYAAGGGNTWSTVSASAVPAWVRLI